LLILSGFLLESLRLAMMVNEGDQYAFIGFYLSHTLRGSPDLSVIYVYFWYMHFIIMAGLVAYLPFSRLKHIIVGPISIAIQSVHEREKNITRKAQEN
jgi:nitrate reductase gamma subunit